jgi:hypothetical protein
MSKNLRLMLWTTLPILGAWPAFPQTVTATLVGTVTDGSGARVANADVTATHRGTGFTRSTRTDQWGNYAIPSLAPGVYTVAAEAVGFKRAVVDDIQLFVDQTARVDFTLQIGELKEVVRVEATAAMVASETSSVGQVIDNTQISNMPLKGRTFFELALLAPGTVPTMPASFVATRRPTPGGLNVPAFYVGGAREENNGYLLDGLDAQDPHYLTPSIFPSVDVIQEFKLEANAYSAEFGRFAVQVNATTRSGTNQLRGSLYEFFRNDALDATHFFANYAGLGKRPLRYNQFGATLGGPIVLPRIYGGRDRSFFFISYEGTRVRIGKTGQLSVPTEEQRNGDFSRLNYRGNRPIFDPATTRPNPAGPGVVRDPFPGNRLPGSRFTPFARTVLALYPKPNLDVAAGNNFVAPLSDISDNNHGMARLDHRFSPNHSVWFRYSIFDGIASDISPIDYGGSSTTTRTHNVGLSYLGILGPGSLVELRLGYNRPAYLILQDGAYKRDYATELGLKNLLREPIAWGVPHVSLSGFSTIGSDTNPTTQLSNVYQVVSHLTLVRGKHQVKLGWEGRKTNYNDRSERAVRGSFNFTGAFTADPQRSTNTGVSVADLLLGLPLTAMGSNTSLAANLNGFSYAAFFQDDWRVASRLTLNLGLRYELNTRYTDVQDRLTLFDGSYPGGRLLLAGRSQAYIPGRGLVEAPRTPRGLLPADRNNWAPRIGLAWRPFGHNRTAIRLGYGIFYTIIQMEDLRTFVRNPPFGEVISLRSDQNGNAEGPEVLRVADLFPERGAPAARPGVYGPGKPYVDPYYQQWNLSMQQQLPANVLVELGYMGSKGTRLTQRINANQAVLDRDPTRPTPILTRRPYPLFGDDIRITLTDANSTYHAGFVKFERRLAQRVSLLASYTFSKSLDGASLFNQRPRDIYNRRLDKGRSSFDLRHRAVMSGTWELPFGKGARYFTEGLPARLLGGWQVNAICQLRSGFPFSVGVSGDIANNGASTQLAHQVGDPWEGDVRRRERWFNTDAFVLPARGTYGTSGRNILDGPGAFDLNISVFRHIRLTEQARLQIRGEFFNILNHTNFGQPGSTVNTTGYGIIQSAADPRIIQLGLRISF